jgi:flagellar basal-body rod modification protein FlgD
MTQVSPVSTPTPAPSGLPSTGTVSADFQVYLQMLTKQLQYQDPLDPMEANEFAVQLATFAGVEQQVIGNELLTGLSSQMATSNMTDVAGWIGKEVRVASSVSFDGKPITISPNPAAVADRAELVVYDEDGSELSRETIPVSAEPIEWAGVTADGAPLPPGIYRFEVVSYASEEVLMTETAEVYAEVAEVRSQGGANILMLEGGIGVQATSVSAIRMSAG